MANKIQKLEKTMIVEPPKVSMFSKRPSMFSGPGSLNARGVSPKTFIPPPVRVTQNKGSGGK